MAKIKNTFVKGGMNKDVDYRLLGQDEYRDALNVSILSNSDGNDGVVHPVIEGTSFRNNHNVGSNSECIGSVVDESSNLIYYFITSDASDYIIEFNPKSGVQGGEVVLESLNPGSILNFGTGAPITANVIVSEENNLRQLSWTDGLNPPRKIYIETAKAWVVDGFTKADILLARKPPFSEPTVEYVVNTNVTKNKIQNEYFLFSYRYIYEGYELSTQSFASETIYIEQYRDDVNSNINAIDISVNTGGADVIGFDIMYRTQDSPVMYLIKSFDKTKDGIIDDIPYVFNFTNEFVYSAIGEDYSSMQYSDVPEIAKTQDVIGDRLMYFNYTNGKDLDITQDVLLEKEYSAWTGNISSAITTYLNGTTPLWSTVGFDFGAATYTKGNILNFNFSLQYSYIYSGSTANYNIQYHVPDDYATTALMFNDGLLQWLTENLPKIGLPGTVSIDVSDVILISLTDSLFLEGAPNTASLQTGLAITYKSDQSQEFGLLYYDDYNRSSSVVLFDNNSVYFDPLVEGNRVGTEVGKVKLTIDHLAPTWSTKYKIVRKSNQYTYDFFIGSMYVWDTDLDEFYLIAREEDSVDKFIIGDEVQIVLAAGVSPDSNVKFRIEEIGGTAMLPDPDIGSAKSEFIVRCSVVSGDLRSFAANFDYGLYSVYYYLQGYVMHEDLPASDLFYEIPGTYSITNREHQGTSQTQSGATPAIVNVTDGDAYFKDFENVEHHKIKDEFLGHKYENVSLTRPSIYSPNAKSNDRKASVSYSDVFVESTSYNGLSTFDSGKGNYRDLDKEHGSIQIGVGRYGDIFIAQEHRLSVILYGKDLLSNADGTSNIVGTESILGQQIYLPYNNGISVNPESFVMHDDFLIFTDANKGEVLKVVGRTVTKISAQGMDSYFKDLFRDERTTKKYGGYNQDKQEYVLSVKDTVTLAYNVESDAWTTAYSYLPEEMINLNGVFYTLYEGQLYEHTSTSNSPNTFYGVKYPSTIETVINKEPSDNKIFKSLNLEGTHAWDIIYKTNMTEGTVDATEFLKKEDEWYAYIRRSTLAGDTTSLATQGVGVATEVDTGTNTIVFGNDIPGNVSVGDSVYKLENNTLYLSGVITDIELGDNLGEGNRKLILDGSAWFSVGEFYLAQKNSREEGSQARGYYLDLKMTLDTTDVFELFAVNVDTATSYE